MALSGVMAFGLISFTACEGTPGKSAYDIWIEQGNTGTEQDFLNSLKGNDGTPGSEGKSAYQAWLDAGNTGNEQDFLDSLIGEPGTTPEITISDDGYWEINGVKTDQKAQGEPGTTPEITISDDGYWEINGVKTDQKAQGEPGKNGNKIYHDKGDPNALNLAAEEGDMYVDTESWHVYFFEGSEWIDYGSIKGKDGSDPKPTPAGTEIDIAADGQREIDVTLSEGFHIIKADLGTTTLTTGKLYAKVGEIDSELVLSETRSEAAGGNKIYYGYVDIKADTTKITISAKGEAVKGSITFEDYVQPTLKADGQAIEVPVNLNAAKDGTGALKLKLDSSIVAGSYTVKITNLFDGAHLSSPGVIGLWISKQFTMAKAQYTGTAGATVTLTQENITAANGECWFYNPTTTVTTPAIFPITITVAVKTA